MNVLPIPSLLPSFFSPPPLPTQVSSLYPLLLEEDKSLRRATAALVAALLFPEREGEEAEEQDDEDTGRSTDQIKVRRYPYKEAS